MTKEKRAREPSLLSIKDAAEELGVHPSTIRKHFSLVRLGDRTLVRAADIQKTISGGQHAVA